MDLREQDERYSSGERSRICAGALRILAAVGFVVALAVVVGFRVDQKWMPTLGITLVFVFSVLAMAAPLWAVATVLRILSHIEENVRPEAHRPEQPLEE
ncbi:MAG: hypothetical protein JW889_06665 [Verrucomicrobia bacterium]|nr:hypothetical protein [Verrucomicrobiota bacterium]